jgi:hypothetical protein
VISFLQYVKWLRKYCLTRLQSDFLDTFVPVNVHTVLTVLCSDESALNSKHNTFEALRTGTVIINVVSYKVVSQSQSSVGV